VDDYLKRMSTREAQLVRTYISNSIANSSNAIKNCWLIMFSAGTFAALSALNLTLRCEGYLSGAPAICPTSPSLWNSSVLNSLVGIVVFVLTFARFYLGDVRIFDEKYSEIYFLVLETIKARQDPQPVAAREKKLLSESLDLFPRLLRYNDATPLKFEGIWLIFQTLIIVFLAFQINDPYNFFTIYGMLLLSNSIWLILTNIVVSSTITQINQQIFYFHAQDNSFVGKFPRLASWRWAINNLLHCAGLCVVVYFSHRLVWGTTLASQQYDLLIWGYAICISNCIFDFVVTRDFYFPKFFDFYKAYEASTMLGVEAAGPTGEAIRASDEIDSTKL
jgi:hypothetical protein